VTDFITAEMAKEYKSGDFVYFKTDELFRAEKYIVVGQNDGEIFVSNKGNLKKVSPYELIHASHYEKALKDAEVAFRKVLEEY